MEVQALHNEEPQTEIQRVRVIFIGDFDAGKTSLIQALLGRVPEETPEETFEEMPPGIEINQWPVPGTDITAHFWDFGIQVIKDATYRFFLRPHCIYVLVLNARSGGDETNRQAEYWLDSVRTFGGNAPVLLVGNKRDLVPAGPDAQLDARVGTGLDMPRLRNKYPNILGVYPLSATGYSGAFAGEFALFREALIAQLAGFGEFRLSFSQKELAIMEALRDVSRRSAFLGTAVFDKLCERRGLGEERRREFPLLLDRLGEITYFPELHEAGFQGLLLNPRWLTHGIYGILYTERPEDRPGMLRREDLGAILGQVSVEDEYGNRLEYPEDLLDFPVLAMEGFGLCYPVPDAKDAWIVPDRLPEERPESTDFDDRDALRFDFKFRAFLPRNLLGELIARHYREIRGHQVWRYGVCLESRGWNRSRALVRADHAKKKISLVLSGPNVDRYFAVLYYSVLEILERTPEIEYARLLHLDESARLGSVRDTAGQWAATPLADFNDLQALEAAGKTKWICRAGIYDLQKLLAPLPVSREKRRPWRFVRDSLKEFLVTLGALGGLAGGIAAFFGLPEKIITGMADTLTGPVGDMARVLGSYPRVIDGAVGIVGILAFIASIVWLQHHVRSGRGDQPVARTGARHSGGNNISQEKTP